MMSPSCTTYSLPSVCCRRLGLHRGHVVAAGGEIVVMHHAGPDEAPLKVGVDLAGRLRGLSAAADGPGAALLLAVGEKADQAQQGVAGLDEVVQAGAVTPISARKAAFSSGE